MTTLELIDWQRQHPKVQESMSRNTLSMANAGRSTALEIGIILLENWRDNDSNTRELRHTLVSAYGKITKKVCLKGARFLVIFDVWALAVIDESLNKLGDPAYSDVNMSDLVAMARKTAAWSVSRV